jgi:hypothetical protein
MVRPLASGAQHGKHTRERTVADEAKDFGFAKKQSLFAELRR